MSSYGAVAGSIAGGAPSSLIYLSCSPLYPSLTPKGLSPAMSPALQRLVSRTASKYTDRALRASYTPSPARSAHLKTPAGGPQTPTSTPAPGSATRTPLSQDPASITDNLLQLPARRKASDFF